VLEMGALLKRLKSTVFVSLMVVFSFNGIQDVSALAAASFSWKVSTLEPSSSISPSKVWSTNSKGLVTWKVTGSGCSRSGKKIATRTTGNCKVTVTVSATSKFKRIVKSKTFVVVTANTVPTTSVANVPTTSVNTVPTTSVALTCATGGSCVVGDTGPGGGIVFYVASGNFTQIGAIGSMCATTCKYLEVSSAYFQVNMAWAQGGFNPSRAVTGADSASIGAGFKNTRDIVAQGNSNQYISAAAYCDALEAGGKSDWFLPSWDEINELYSKSSVVGGFSFGLYWTSTEFDARTAWSRYMTRATFGDLSKASLAYVRPVRAF
jgi:hypothetical protein